VILHRDLPLPRHLIAQAVILALIGVGSTCFHSTLRYNQQLWDELPMYWWDPRVPTTTTATTATSILRVSVY
jgi:hypothetical protein